MFVHILIFGQVQILIHRIHLLPLRLHLLGIQTPAYFLVSLLSFIPGMRFYQLKNTDLFVTSLLAGIDDSGFYVHSVLKVVVLFFLRPFRTRCRRRLLRDALVVNSAAI